MTTLYLGWLGAGPPLKALADRRGKAALLVAYPVIGEWNRMRGVTLARSWCLDSGAFSARNQGLVIDLDQYIGYCLKVLRSDNPPSEIFALDVIGDPDATERNVRAMHAAGVPAIPTFHYGSPWSVLKDLCAEYPKVGLGGIGGNWTHTTPTTRARFLDGCFAIGWPSRFHGFGVGNARNLRRYPFHSADATTWGIGPKRYRNWSQFSKGSGGMAYVPTKVRRHNDLNIVGEVDYYLRLEREARGRWKRELELLEALK